MKLIILTTIFLLVYTNVHSEVTPLQQQVLDDYKAMLNMDQKQRQEYREAINKNKTSADRKAYTQAFKAVRPILPEYLGVSEDPLKSKKKANANQPKSPVKIAGTSIQYDTGTVFGGAGVSSQMLGNRFDSALNAAGTMCCFPVESSGSITMITFNMINTQFSSVVFSIYSNIMGTTAPQVTSMGIGGVATGLNTITLGTATVNSWANGSFLAGIWQFDPTMTGLAIDSNSTGGQGFHAISLNDAAVGNGLTTVTAGGMGANAIFRVKGNVATPVELLNFTIE